MRRVDCGQRRSGPAGSRHAPRRRTAAPRRRVAVRAAPGRFGLPRGGEHRQPGAGDEVADQRGQEHRLAGGRGRSRRAAGRLRRRSRRANGRRLPPRTRRWRKMTRGSPRVKFGRVYLGDAFAVLDRGSLRFGFELGGRDQPREQAGLSVDLAPRRRFEIDHGHGAGGILDSEAAQFGSRSHIPRGSRRVRRCPDCGRRSRRSRPIGQRPARGRTASPESRRRARSPPAVRPGAAIGRRRFRPSEGCATRPSGPALPAAGSWPASRAGDAAGVVAAAVGQRALVVVLPDTGFGLGVTDEEQTAHGVRLPVAMGLRKPPARKSRRSISLLG